jgi:tRNA A58 N-methylase Trm61
MLKLAETNPSDTFVDLGCGDASVLIFAVKNFNIRKAIGYEISAIRYNMALENIRKTHLTNRITINLDDISNANVFEADIIFDMLPESEHIVEKLYQSNIKKGTRLIKHDLPLIGFLADKIDYPFYY